MEFGLYVDPAVVTQRHALYDSDEEDVETEKEEINISFSDCRSSIAEGGTLLIAVGLTTSIFVQSYPVLESESCCSILANSETIFKDKYFPSGSQERKGSRDDLTRLSEVYGVKNGASGTRSRGNCFVCVHEKPLKADYCNMWASKVWCEYVFTHITEY